MKIALFTKNRINPAYEAARKGGDIAAARLGATVSHYVPRHPDHGEEQAVLLEQAIDEHPDAIVIAPVDPTSLTVALGKVTASKIPMVGFISRMPDAPWIAFVGSDDRQLARTLATRVFTRLEGVGEVVIVDGPRETQTSVDRALGFRDAVVEFPGIRIAGECNGRYVFEAAQAAVASLLDRLQRVDAVVAANDVMALGAVRALREKRRSALVAGVNAIPEAIAAIKRGNMIATADFNAMNIAAMAVECAIRHVRGERVPRNLMLPVDIVDHANVALWDRPYGDRPVIEWDEALRFGAGP